MVGEGSKEFKREQICVSDSFTMSLVDENIVANMTTEHMKLAPIESPIGLDRLATENEVRCAVTYSSHGSFKLCGISDGASDYAGYVGVFRDVLLWLARAAKC